MSNAFALEADCVCHRYGDRQVLSSASIRAMPGHVTGLLGRNGAGKTTLLRILVGLLQPDNGVVRTGGTGLLYARLANLARHGVFFLPARDLLLPGLTVLDHMRSMRDRFGGRADLGEIAEVFGIADRVHQVARTLSGGEKRRAELAVAFAREPRVLVADEPLRGITPIDADVIMRALTAFARRGGAVIVTGHELPLLLPHLDRVTWCHLGKTHEFATVAAALEDFAFRRDFLPVA